jgi:hypothetical protein
MAEFKLGRLRFVWKGTWTAATAYVKDDIVRHGGKTYVAKTAHTSASNFYTDSDANRWELMTDGIQWINIPWTASTVYKEGDIVRYGGKVYLCIDGHTANSTQDGGFYTDLGINRWSLFVDGITAVGDWTVSTYYKLGDIAKYNGITYICIDPHTSAGSISSGLEADDSKWDVFSEGIKYRGSWSENVRYILNDVVKFGASLYICALPHTSTSVFEDNRWFLFTAGFEFDGIWSGSVEYQIGDVTRYGGYLYIATVRNTGQVPTGTSGNWDLLAMAYSTNGRYSNVSTYKPGEVVTHGGNTFVANQEIGVGETPVSNEAKWDLLVAGVRWTGDWDTDITEITYKINDLVKYVATTYICVREHVPSELNRPDLDVDGTNWIPFAEGADINVMTRRGDLVTRNAIQNVRLARGDAGQILKIQDNGLDLEWGNVGSITNIYYVSTEGIDGPTRGTSIDQPFRTIKFACDFVRTQSPATFNNPAVIMVKTGVYDEVFPISVPKFTSLVGDELRMSIVQPTPATSHLDKFYMRDSTTIRNFTFRGATGAPEGGFTETNQYGTQRPTGGAWCALDPGTGPNDEEVWVGARSPYIQNVTTFGDNAVGQKIDGALHNGGNKSITSNDFTQVMSDSIGAWCTNQGRAELVSVFTYYSYIGYLCENGGVIRATNGNNSYGTFGSVSEGVDPTEISRTATVDNRRLNAIVDVVQTDGESVLYLEYLNAGETYTAAEYAFTGSGIAASISVVADIANGGVAEVRVLSDGDSYVGVQNNAQLGEDTYIRLGASDIQITNGYNGMRIVLTDGAGVGQYAFISNFNGGSKDANVNKESFTPISVTAVNSTGNLFTTASTTTLSVNMPINFQGTVIGDVVADAIYYVKSIESGTTFTVSETISGGVAGTVFDPGTDTGVMILYASGWDVFADNIITNITDATQANPVVITTALPHGLKSTWNVRISGVIGMTELNGNTYHVNVLSNTSFALYSNYGLTASVDGTGFTAYDSSGSINGKQSVIPFLNTTTRYVIEPRPVFSTGEGASATAVRTLGINELTITDGGKGYTEAPTPIIGGPDTVLGAVNATATTTIAGPVDFVVVNSKGGGYSSAPTLQFVGGGLPTDFTNFVAETTVEDGDFIFVPGTSRFYEVIISGELGTTAPTHTSGTVANGTATLLYLGRRATATANMTNVVKTVLLSAGGVGYTSTPSVQVTGAGGSGAIISSTISQVINEIVLNLAGAGYTSSPLVTLVGGDPIEFATARAVLTAELTSVNIVEGGNGYVPSTTTITVAAPPAGGTTATVEAVIDFGAYIPGITSGTITSIVIVNPGSGYETNPLININGVGSGASAQSIITGTVDRIELINRGRGYVSTPTVNISGGGGQGASATASRTGSVNSITIIDGGLGYTSNPTLEFIGGGLPNGSASHAQALVASTDLVIQSVTITDVGDNYTSNPAVSIVGGGGTGATLRARINGEVKTITVTDPGSNYSDVVDPVIAFSGGRVYKSPVAGLRYFTDSNSLTTIGISQITQTLAAIQRTAVLAKAVVANTDPSVSYQLAISRTAGGVGYSTPTGIAFAVDAWVNSVYITIENGQNHTNSAELLRLNRSFLRADAMQFLANNYPATSDNSWSRDIGLIIDAIARDIETRGVVNSTTAGIKQAFLTAKSAEPVAVLAVMDFLRDSIVSVVQNIIIVPQNDGVTTWEGLWVDAKNFQTNDVVFFSGKTYVAQSNHFSNALFSIDLAAGRWIEKLDGQATIDVPLEPGAITATENLGNYIKSLLEYAPASASFSAAATLLLNNSSYIKAEIIAFINNTYEDFVYNQVLSARDIGFILDAVAYDVVNALDAEATATASTTGVISSIAVDDGGDGYSAGVQITLSGGGASGSPTVTATAVAVRDPLSGEIIDFTMTNKGKGYASLPTVTITPDTGSGVVARSRVVGGNVSKVNIIHPGSGFTAGPFLKLIDPNNSGDAVFEVRVADGVLKQPRFTARGTGFLTAGSEISGNGYAEIAQTGSFIYVKNLTNIPTPGANIQFEDNDIFYKLVTVREVVGPQGTINARAILLSNKAFIQAEVISYLNNFTFDSVKCSRDIGYIIDALADDSLTGSNQRLLAVRWQYARGLYSTFNNQRIQTAFVLEYLQGEIDQLFNYAENEISKTLDDLIEWIKNEEYYKNVKVPLNPPAGYDAENDAGSAVLTANREFIAGNALRRFINNAPVGAYEINLELWLQEFRQVVDSVAYDTMYAGNQQVIEHSSTFYSGVNFILAGYTGDTSVVKAEFVNTLTYIKTLVQDIVQNNVVASLQSGYTVGGTVAVVDVSTGDVTGPAQNRTLSAGDTGTAFRTGALCDDFISIVNSSPTTIGVTVTSSATSFAGFASGDVDNRTSLLAFKSTLQTLATNWLDDEFVNFTYDQVKCSRDVGIIVQAIADDIFGDVAKSVEAGQRYYAATAALVISEQKPQTIAAINWINEIVQRVTNNVTWVRTQNRVFQERFPSLSGMEEALPILTERVNIIKRIVEYGGFYDQVKQILLDNKLYIQAEVVSFVDATYENLNYNRSLCSRDAGLIVDALIYDIYGGLSRSREAGLRYYQSASALVAITGDQLIPTTTAINYLRQLAQAVIINENPSVQFQEDVLRLPITTNSGSIEFVAVISGSNYSQGTTITVSTGGSGAISGEIAATIDPNTGSIVEANVIDGGSGFVSPPALSITKPTAVVKNYVNIASVTLTVNDTVGIFVGMEVTGEGFTSGQRVIAVNNNGISVELSATSDSQPSGSITFTDIGTGASATAILGVAYSIDHVSELLVDQKIDQSTTALLSIISGGPSALPPGRYAARLQVSPEIPIQISPPHDTNTVVRSKYSQVRLTGHDFLNIGTGNKNDTNYPGIPLNAPDQANEVVEVGGGRVFYTSTDQDGNFRVGELFRVEQSTGIATLNADAFNLSGLNELSLGGVTLGGSGAVIREFSTDSTFFANSDNIVPTQKAIKTYIQASLGSGGGNIAVNAVIAGEVLITGDEITTTSGVPIRFTNAAGLQFLGGANSTSTTTGTIRVGTVLNPGGIGVTGNVYVGGVVNTQSLVSGSIDNTPIGANNRSTALFTTVGANGIVSLTAGLAATSDVTGTLRVSGGAGVTGDIFAGGNISATGSISGASLDNTPIGASTRSSGLFTTLAANDSVQFTRNVNSTSTGTGTLAVVGGIGLTGNITVGQALRLAGATSGTTGFQAPASAGSTIYVLPGADGAAGTSLVTNGSGVLSWGQAGATIADNTTTNSTFYPTFVNVTTGGVTSLNVSSTKMTFNPSSGLLTITALTESSSIALKENVNPITDALDNVLKLVGVTYDRRDGTRNNEPGLIAEEVNKVIPNLVTKDADGNPDGVHYSKLTAYLVEAIKTLKAEIDQLKNGK